MVSCTTRAAALIVALSLVPIGVEPAAAQILTLVDQDRSVFGFVIVPQCGGDDSESEAAKGFERFNALASAGLSCESASGLASAQQRSVLAADTFQARGQTVSQAAATVNNTIHAIAVSFFEVEFSVDAPARFRLSGLIRSASSADFILGGAQVRLTGPEGVTIFDELVVPGPDGEPTVLEIDERGRLDPGSYTLRATADSVIDNEVPPNRFVLASYQMTFAALPASN